MTARAIAKASDCGAAVAREVKRTGRGRVWTPQDIADLASMYSDGVPIKDMAAHFEVSREALKSRLRTGFQRTRRQPRMDDLAELMSRGFTLKQSAARLGMTYGTAKSTWQRIKARLGAQAV